MTKEPFVSALPLPRPRQPGLEESLERLGDAIAAKKAGMSVAEYRRIKASTKEYADAHKRLSDRIMGELDER